MLYQSQIDHAFQYLASETNLFSLNLAFPESECDRTYPMLKLLLCLSIPRSRSSYFYIFGILILSQCDRLLFVRLLFLSRLIDSVGRVFPIRFACSLSYLHCIHDSVSSLWSGIVLWLPAALSVKMHVAAPVHCH